MKLPNKEKNEVRNAILQAFAEELKEIDNTIDFKISSRGWCYQLENMGEITKAEFKKIEKVINECRKKGYLPLDFTADDKNRAFSNGDYVSEQTPLLLVNDFLNTTLNLEKYYYPDFWKNEKYYIMMLVEKIDLVELFKPICDKYNIPIANSKGWADINMRGIMAEKYKIHEERGRIPILLYCGDLDPIGVKISDNLMKNMKDIELATEWNPENLRIDRFGLNIDYVNKYKLSWIDEFISGTGKPYDESKPAVKNYIEKYGRRKVEANALVIQPRIARELCENTIVKWLGKNALNRIEAIKQRCNDWFKGLYEYYNIKDPILKILKKIKKVEVES